MGSRDSLGQADAARDPEPGYDEFGETAALDRRKRLATAVLGSLVANGGKRSFDLNLNPERLLRIVDQLNNLFGTAGLAIRNRQRGEGVPQADPHTVVIQ